MPKLWVTLLGLSFSFSAFAATCPDLSGKYHVVAPANDEDQILTITQKDCNSIQMDWTLEQTQGANLTRTVDGQTHIIGDASSDVQDLERWSWGDNQVQSTQEKLSSTGAVMLNLLDTYVLDSQGYLTVTTSTVDPTDGSLNPILEVIYGKN